MLAADCDASAEAIILSIGANDICSDVQKHLDESSTSIRALRLIRLREDLPSGQPDRWLQIAAEVAGLISTCDARDIYLFADIPAVLCLMVGDALGPYKGRIHLMQYTNPGYKDVFVIPHDLPK